MEKSCKEHVDPDADIMERLHVKQHYEDLVRLCAQAWQHHPMATFCVGVGLVTTLPPVVCFIAFVAGSLFLALLGFICVEGFLLFTGLLVLGAVLGVLLFLAGMFCIFSLICWLVANHISAYLQNNKVKHHWSMPLKNIPDNKTEFAGDVKKSD